MLRCLDLWNEDVFEVFWWPDERYPVYFEQVGAGGTTTEFPGREPSVSSAVHFGRQVLQSECHLSIDDPNAIHSFQNESH